jgi:hypothetical protein
MEVAVARYRLMVSKLLGRLLIIVAAMCLVPETNADFGAGQNAPIEPMSSGAYMNPEVCSKCHQRIFGQYTESMHAKAFSDPVFFNQVYNVLLPQAKRNPELMRRAGLCLACHSPTTFLTQGQRLPPREYLNQNPDGVTCDFCHTISGYKGSVPGSANYISSPGETKLGPLKFNTTYHHQYSALHRKSEFCGICHDATNAHGVQMLSTYSEWKSSPWPEKGIQCQDCHMNVFGRLVDGKPVFESGTLASGILLSPSEREQVYTHKFPGASVPGQIKPSVKFQVQNFPDKAKPGSMIVVVVELDNSEAGHGVPTGAIELRLMWLDVKLRMQDSAREWALKVKPDPGTRWDIAGMSPTDAAMLGPEIADGSRLYRAVFVDEKGLQTHNYWEAADKVFDNRIRAGEVRVEMFRFTVPSDASGELEAEATLRYLRYPSGFAKRLEIPPAESVLVAKASKIIKIAP